MQDVKSYPVPWIKVVEKLDESAFHRKHMFQVVVVPSGPTLLPDMPSQITLYLQAAVRYASGCLLFVCLFVCVFKVNMHILFDSD